MIDVNQNLSYNIKDVIKLKIAIDGPSGAGKSTITKEISKKLNIDYLDTGAMYRTLALYFKENNFTDFNNDDKVFNFIKNIDIDVKNGNFYLFNKNVSKDIRDEEIGLLASKISSLKIVREYLVAKQKEIAQDRDIVMDGRDVGTVILQDADYKIFLTANLDERAQRRFDELTYKDVKVKFEDVKKSLEKRDFDDINREHSPLIKADDAIEVDSSKLNIIETIDLILKIINEEDN